MAQRRPSDYQPSMIVGPGFRSGYRVDLDGGSLKCGRAISGLRERTEHPEKYRRSSLHQSPQDETKAIRTEHPEKYRRSSLHQSPQDETKARNKAWRRNRGPRFHRWRLKHEAALSASANGR